MRAAINLLIGDEGIGKSLLWVWIVAAVTTGKALPAFGIPARTPAYVVLVITEDDWQTTVLPRLIVAGANLRMIRVICTEDDGSGAPTFPRDLFLIYEADPAPALIIVDAWLDTVPAGIVVRDPQGARQALHPWRELATQSDAAVLLLCHTNRVASAVARDRYGATAELRKKARMTLYAQSDDDGHLVVGPEKMNTAAPIPATTFAIQSVQHFEPTADDDGTVPRLEYIGESDRTAREHIADAFVADGGGDRQERADAKNWLKGYIELQGPQVLSAEVKREAVKAGFSERTLQRARQDLKVIYGWTGNPPKTAWSLPTEPSESDGIPGTAGIATGRDAMPRYATGTAVAQGTDQPKGDGVPAVPPDIPPLCPGCSRGPARADDGPCDFCTAEARRQAIAEAQARLGGAGA